MRLTWCEHQKLVAWATGVVLATWNVIRKHNGNISTTGLRVLCDHSIWYLSELQVQIEQCNITCCITAKKDLLLINMCLCTLEYWWRSKSWFSVTLNLVAMVIVLFVAQTAWLCHISTAMVTWPILVMEWVLPDYDTQGMWLHATVVRAGQNQFLIWTIEIYFDH